MFLKFQIESLPWTPVYVLILQIFSSYLAYVMGKFACKIVIQGFSYAFPVIMTVPLTVIGLITACGLRNDDECRFKGTIPDYLFFSCPGGDFLQVKNKTYISEMKGGILGSWDPTIAYLRLFIRMAGYPKVWVGKSKASWIELNLNSSIHENILPFTI